MDKELIKKLVNLTVIDVNYHKDLMKYIDNEDWNTVRLVIEKVKDSYDISDTGNISARLLKSKLELYKVSNNLYSEYMEQYNLYLDKMKEENVK